MKKIAVGTLKGGVCKSTFVISISSLLAEMGYNVLVIDGDPQASSSSFLRLNETVENYKSIKNVYDDKNTKPSEVIVHTFIKNLDVIGSTILLTENEGKLYNTSLGELYLKKYFNANAEFFNEYDYILFDTNPSMSKLNCSIFATVDKIICVSDVAISAFKGMQMFDYLLSELIEAADLSVKIEALVVNKVDLRTTISKDYLEFLKNEDLTKDIVLTNYINFSVKFAEAETNQTPINLYYPKSVPNKDYKAVITELFEKGVL